MNQKVNDKSTRKCTESQYAITGDCKMMLNEKARTTPTDGIEMPSIAGLRCRGFRGEADYPAMAAVIARSLAVLKAQGMTEAALGVDADNPNGALGLYQSMGYETVKRYLTYRKSLDGELSVLQEESG